MTEVPCKDCNVKNDYNALKCENCKAILLDFNYADESVCESEFRFIEEAELRGEVYKVERVEDEYIPLDFQDEEGELESEIKVEADVLYSDNISENWQIANEGDYMNKSKGKKTSPTIVLCKTATADGPPYECSKCSKSFKRKATLKAHENTEHNLDGDTWFTCIPIQDQSGLKMNLKRSMSTPTGDSSDSEYMPSSNDERENKKRKRFKSSLKSKRTEEYSCDSDSENNNSAEKSNYKSRMSSPAILDKTNMSILTPRTVFKCTACEKISYNFHEHKKHIVIHEAPAETLTEKTSLEKLKKTPSGFYKCKQCTEVFMIERDFSLHKKMHKGYEVFRCDICGSYLANKSSLSKHYVRMHKGKPPKESMKFECIVCNEKFPSRNVMLYHKKSHTDVLKRMEEMTIIDKDGGKTIYVCKICAKTSKNKYRHEEHLRVHTREKPYKCEICKSRISTANALVHHMRLHENERPFKCEICEATYRHKRSLTKHLRQHTGKKPFKCRSCDSTFYFNYTRADHERNCHLGGSHQPRRRKRWSGEEVTNRTTVPENFIKEPLMKCEAPNNIKNLTKEKSFKDEI